MSTPMNARELAERAQELAEAAAEAPVDTHWLRVAEVNSLTSIALSLAVIAEKVRTS